MELIPSITYLPVPSGTAFNSRYLSNLMNQNGDKYDQQYVEYIQEMRTPVGILGVQLE